MLPDSIILFHIAPFLTLDDVVIYISTCKHISRLSTKLLSGMKCVTVPDTYILRFMRKLTKKCPNVSKLRMRIFAQLSERIVRELNKLPLVSFECIRYDGNEDDTLIYEGKELKLPKLEYLYVSDLYRFNPHSEKLSVIRVAVTGHWNNAMFRRYSKLRELIIDSYEPDEPSKAMFDFPISKINMKFSKQLISCVNPAVLKSLRLTYIDIKSKEIIPALEILQLHELDMPCIPNMNKIIAHMPLETLIIRKSYTPTGPILYPRLKNKTIKTLVFYNQDVDFGSLINLRNLNTLILHNCDVEINTILPIKYLELNECHDIPERIAELPLLSLIIRNTDEKLKMNFPRSLQTLILSDVEGDYSNWPELPYLTKLHIAEINCDFKDYDTVEICSDDEVELIPDGAFRTMAKSPIRDLKIAGRSLCDSNVHYFANTPINYLNIKFTRVTAVGLMTLKGLPLRKLVIPNIPAHHLFQLH